VLQSSAVPPDATVSRCTPSGDSDSEIAFLKQQRDKESTAAKFTTRSTHISCRRYTFLSDTA
jgi:hypothetical protein